MYEKIVHWVSNVSEGGSCRFNIRTTGDRDNNNSKCNLGNIHRLQWNFLVIFANLHDDETKSYQFLVIRKDLKRSGVKSVAFPSPPLPYSSSILAESRWRN